MQILISIFWYCIIFSEMISGVSSEYLLLGGILLQRMHVCGSTLDKELKLMATSAFMNMLGLPRQVVPL